MSTAWPPVTRVSSASGTRSTKEVGVRVTWSASTGATGETTLPAGGRFIVARRMDLPGDRLVTSVATDGDHLLLVRLPYVSDPAVVLTATQDQPALYRGQRANGAIVELRSSRGDTSSPAAGQHVSLPHEHSEVILRFPDLVLTLTVAATLAEANDSGTAALNVASLEHDDAWLVGALAVALSPPHGVVAHAVLLAAFAQWRGIAEPSVGAFDRGVLRPALERRSIELPGPRLNKIVYLVERCRAVGEFPAHILDEVRNELRS